MKCPICNELNIEWPIIDAATSFTFCDGCYSKVKDIHFAKYDMIPDLSAWLKSIADARDETIKKF